MNMKYIRIIKPVVIALITIMALSSCGGIKKLADMSVDSAKVVELTPNGLKGLKLGLALDIDNPGAQVSLSDISCQVKHFGKVLGTVGVDPFTLHGRVKETYYMKAEMKMGKGMSILEAGKLFDTRTIEELSVDLHAKVKLKSGLSKEIEYKDVPLKKLLEAAKK